MNNIEDNQKEILKKKKYENDIIFNSRSNIIKSLDDIDFIIERLRNDVILKNKQITFNPLFKATRDGNKSSDFHKKCDGKVQQLIFIKTTKGETFGGYTEIGFRSRGGNYEDNNSFIFSFSTKKIYGVVGGCDAIYDHKDSGPCFSGKEYCTIYIPSKMFDDESYINKRANSNFKGIIMDYEINNGEKTFHVQEIEVYQILYG